MASRDGRHQQSPERSEVSTGFVLSQEFVQIILIGLLNVV